MARVACLMGSRPDGAALPRVITRAVVQGFLTRKVQEGHGRGQYGWIDAVTDGKRSRQRLIVIRHLANFQAPQEWTCPFTQAPR